MRRLMSALLTVAMVCSLVPTPALAEAVEEVEVGVADDQDADGQATVQDVEVVEEPDEQAVVEEEDANATDVQGIDQDAFRFVDAQSGETVTTLHTSRQYLLKDASGQLYNLPMSYLYFTCRGSDGRGNTDHMYRVDVQCTSDEEYNGECACVVRLEAVSTLNDWDNWALPTGTYTVAYATGWEDDAPRTNLSQTYQIVCDGPFHPFFAGGDGLRDNGEFGIFVYGAENNDERLSTLSLTDELRLRMEVLTAVDLHGTGVPTLQGIALWKAPAETVEDLEEQYDWDKYFYQGIDGWPNIWNIGDADGLTYLWERSSGGSDIDERFSRATTTWEHDGVTTEYCDGGTFVVPRVSFADATNVQSGMYFPVVKASYGGETYTYVYYPVEVDATGIVGHGDPRITTRKLADAALNDPYTATLVGRSGTGQEGELTWVVVDGQLPLGLALNGATGTISGTPTELGSFEFTVQLTETIDGESRTATKRLTLNVRRDVTLRLGEISYDPGVVRLPKTLGEQATIDLRVPISHDVSDPAWDLGKTEVWYALKIASDRSEPTWYVARCLASDVLSEDGKTLMLKPLVHSYTEGAYVIFATGIESAAVMLVPRHDDGSYAFDTSNIPANALSSLDSIGYELFTRQMVPQGEYFTAIGDADMSANGAWDNLPEMPATRLENPDITFGSYVRFCGLDRGVGQTLTGRARVRLWPAGVVPTESTVQEREITDNGPNSYYDDGHADFDIDPGTYVFTVEAPVQVYDEYGEPIDGEYEWVDVTAGQSEFQEARGYLQLHYDEESIAELTERSGTTPAVSGTSPRQYLVTVGPNHMSRIKLNLTSARIANIGQTTTHSARVSFEHLPDDEEDNVYKSWETRWYRRKDNEGGEPIDVLVGTGDYVLLGPSELPLYVEVIPLGETARFWKEYGPVRVSEKNKVTNVEVARRSLFTGTFKLSCVSGNTPAGGGRWGMIEVQTPLVSGGLVSSNKWVGGESDTVSVGGLCDGSIVTFTPDPSLKAGPVSYLVENQTGDFTAPTDALRAPLPDGLVTFGGLSYTSVDGRTQIISLTDPQTTVEVKRAYSDGYSYEAPFNVMDGGSIVIQPGGRYSGKYADMQYYLACQPDRQVTYRITVTHHDTMAPERLGITADDFAVRAEFEVTLKARDAGDENSANKPIEATAKTTEPLVTRGYANVTLDNPQGMACELLLYHTNGKLVDHGMANGATSIRTPFVAAGNYTLFAVDAGLIDTTNTRDYDEQGKLERTLSRSQNAGRGTSITFDVANGAIATPAQALAFPTWSVTELVDRANSLVGVTNDYSDKLTVNMRAALVQGVRLGDGAYIEVVTNQGSQINGAGYTNPRALNINGKAVAINRWTNLFGGYQNMCEGTLRIMLGELKQIDADLTRFPMTMKLVIPRRNMTSTEVQVWLVSGTGNKSTRSLVGAYRQQVREASITAPPVAAWKTFGVYGQTGPNAYVTVYVDGMRAGTAYADDYGFYQTDVRLPDDAQDFDEFAVSASAQWTSGTELFSASTGISRVLYSTSYPAIERITMCYQTDVGSDYQRVVTYERGRLPNKHRTLYRSEHDSERDEDTDHAKFYWIVEFANDEERVVRDVSMRVPRSDGAVSMSSTDKLATGISWIPDVARAAAAKATNKEEEWWHASFTGRETYEALTNEKLHAFVSRPTYFVSSPHELEVSFKLGLDEQVIEPMEPCADMGVYEGWRGTKIEEAGITQEQLASYIDAMGSSYVRLCAGTDVSGLGLHDTVDTASLTSSSVHAQNLLDDEAGRVDEWMLVSNGAGQAVKVHHQVSSTMLSAAELRQEVDGRLAAAKKVTDAYEAWFQDGIVPTDPSVAWYQGCRVIDAGGIKSTGTKSIPYIIETYDDDGDVQVEAFYQYKLEETGEIVHHLDRMTKKSWTSIQWNEKHNQRVELTYTLADECVDSLPNGGALHFADVVEQWYWIQRYLLSSVCAADQELMGNGGEANDEQVGGQSDDASVTVQDPVADVVETGATWIVKCSGQSTGLLPDESQYPARLDDLRNNPQKATEYAATPDSDWWNSPQAQSGTLGGVNNFGEKGPLMADMTTTVTYNSGEAMVGARNGPSAWLGISTFFLPPVRAKCEEGWKNTIDNVNGNNAGEDDEDEDEEAKKREREDYRKFKEDRYRICYGLDPSPDYFRIAFSIGPEKREAWSKQADEDTKNWTWLKGDNPDTIHDPSGIVYEAVLSNPVQGATATLYTFNDAAYNAGMDDPAQFIDSKQVGIEEENPQVTGADGRYQWFVPEGYWQVRVTKEGYEDFSTGDSRWGHTEQRAVYDDAYNPVLNDDGTPRMQTVDVGDYGVDATRKLVVHNVDGTTKTIETTEYWMPVLPVQLDVNIGLVSTDTPRVESVAADEGSVTVTFSQYVKVGSVTTGMFSLGGKAPVSIAATDAEAAGDGSGVQLARTFRLVYADGAYPAAGGTVHVGFNDALGKLQNYASKAMAEEDRTYAQAAEVKSGGVRKVAKPRAASFTYDGSAKVGVEMGQGYVLSGTARATNAGRYDVTATPKSGYAWTDGTRAVVKLSWSIAKAAGSVRASAATCEVLLKKAKKKAQKVRPVSVASSIGGVTFEKVSGAKELSVAADGTVTLKKGVKKAKSLMAVVRVTAAGDANHNAASIDVPIVVKVVKKLTNPMVVTEKAVKIKAGKSGVVLKVSKAKGKLSYKKSGGAKQLSVNKKSGKVTVKKGTKKGTYKIKIKVTAAGNATYKKVTKTVACEIAVK